MLAWIQFAVTAVLLLLSLVFLALGVLGNCRFLYVMNRMHAAGLGDTLGLFLCALALSVSADGLFLKIRFFLPLVFLWISSPVSTHFLAQIEYFTNRKLEKHMDRVD